MKKTPAQIAEAAMDAADTLTSIDRRADRLSRTLAMKVEVCRFNVTDQANGPVSYRVQFTEADRMFRLNRSMTRSEASHFMAMLQALADAEIIAGVVTGGPLRDDRPDMRQPGIAQIGQQLSGDAA